MTPRRPIVHGYLYPFLTIKPHDAQERLWMARAKPEICPKSVLFRTYYIYKAGPARYNGLLKTACL